MSFVKGVHETRQLHLPLVTFQSASWIVNKAIKQFLYGISIHGMQHVKLVCMAFRMYNVGIFYLIPVASVTSLAAFLAISADVLFNL